MMLQIMIRDEKQSSDVAHENRHCGGAANHVEVDRGAFREPRSLCAREHLMTSRIPRSPLPSA
jgi:hypothetical protein